MKILSSKTLSFLIILTTILTGCGDDDGGGNINPNDDLFDIIQSQTGTTDSLARALQNTGLDAAVGTISSGTVFGPSNQAFSAYMTAENISDIADIPEDVLSKILRYHVTPSSLRTNDLSDGDRLATLVVGDSLSVSVSGGNIMVGNGTDPAASITRGDLEATNGVLHIIDEIILPPSGTAPSPTIYDFLVDTDSFSTLVTAIDKYPVLVQTLDNPSQDFTLFAPGNTAFDLFFTDSDFESIDDIPSETLEAYLRHHLIIGSVVSTSLSDGDFLLTNNNTRFQVTVTEGGDISIGDVNVIETDIPANNGYIHTIDGILIPSSSSAAQIATDNGLTTLVAALDSAGLLSTLSGSGEFTVLAPTNEAFDAYLDEVGLTAEELLSPANRAILSRILNYHVVNSFHPSNSISDGDTLITLNNNFITFQTDESDAISILNEGGVDNAVLDPVDLLSTNGVVHVIDQVLAPNTIADQLVANPDYSTFVQALITSGVLGTLQDDSQAFTVFAPDNNAFDTFIAMEGDDINSVEDLLAQSNLSQIMLYHIGEGKMLSSTLTSSNIPTLLTNTTTNESVSISVTAGEQITLNNTATVIFPFDQEANNGVIHTIDNVLTPPAEQ
ncbi:fasciclin domain-containing protein [Limibacter armeniacum]|uniref:fasciclin domain-containing protein n=1 Tax=Limibacter armeniacum TaxID=466084 RepID=UPI002FE4FEA1